MQRFLLTVFVLLAISLVQSRLIDETELYNIAHNGVEVPTIVKFYSDRCGFCVGLAPHWEELTRLVKEEDLFLDVVEFDVTTIADQGKIQSLLPGPLPGISLYVPGDTTHFYENPFARGIQNVDQLIEFALIDWENLEPTFIDQDAYFTTKTDLFFVESEQKWNQLIAEEGAEYIIMVAGPKCGWCKNFLPHFREFAGKAKDAGITATVGWINGLKNFGYIERYTARPWPSLIYFVNGHFYRMDTEDVRAIENGDQLVSWFTEKKYLELDDEHQGDDKELVRINKLAEAKARSRKNKQEKSADIL